jgi:branched-chain amino acid transport system permease protein
VLQLLIAGLTVGSEFALIALGIHIILRATRVVNFAQGEFSIVGGLIALTCAEALHVNAWFALAGATFAGFVLGLVFEIAVLRPAGRAGGEAGVTIATIGAVFVLLYGHALIPGWGSDSHPLAGFGGPLNIVILSSSKGGGAIVQVQSLWVFALLLGALAALYLFFERTYYGKAIRAAAENPLGARLVGIDVNSARAISVALGIALAAYGGTIIGPITLVGGAAGFALTIKGFVAAIVGGLESPAGCVAGGFVVGVLQVFLQSRMSYDVADPLVYSVLLLMLLVRPQGLFGRRDAVRD